MSRNADPKGALSHLPNILTEKFESPSTSLNATPGLANAVKEKKTTTRNKERNSDTICDQFDLLAIYF